MTLKGDARSGTIRDTLAGLILTYTPGNNAPLVESQPQSVTNGLYPGGSFTWSALASGTPALAYQWQTNGVDIAGATGTTYSKSGVGLGDTGNYTVVVTNNYGSVTSAVAVVTVQNVVAPVITQGPASQSLYAGYPVTFTVAATGGQLTYQWKSNTVPVVGATNASYTIPSITPDNADTYTVEVNNPVGPVASASATLTVKVAAPGSYESIVAQTKPLIWYRYGETGAVAQDTAANTGSLGAPGTGLYIGNTTHPVPGALAGSSDQAAGFAGGRVSVAYSASLNPATFTIEAWLKPDVALTGGTLTSPLASMQVADPREGWNFYQSASGWNFRTYNENSTTPAVNITGGPAPVAGQWYHVVASWDGSVGRVYVNGVLSVPSAATNFIANPSAAFTVGARSDGPFAWSGAADEVAYYATVLSDAQILAHYQNGTNASPSQTYSSLIAGDNPVEYLRLGDAAFTGTVANNSGTLGAAENGTVTDAGGVVGSPQIDLGQAGPLPPTYPGFESTNRAVAMTNGYTSAPGTTNLSVNNLTVVGWVYVPNASGNTAQDLSWITWLGDSGQSGFFLNSANELRYQWNNDPGSYNFASGLIVPAGTWTFAAMVIQPTQATLYMSSGTNLLFNAQTLNHAAITVNSQLGFGGNQPGRPLRTYVGQLDESAVYNRALSSSEIYSLFLVGTGAPYTVGIVPGGILPDTKPAGTPHNGVNVGLLATWTNSFTDAASKTRTGVEQFSAVNGSQITVAPNADFVTPNGTICFWMQTASDPLPGPGNEGAMLFDNRAPGSATGAVIVLNVDGSIHWQGPSGAPNSLSSGGYLPDGNWHHVAVTYGQTTSDTISFYIDGALASSVPVTNAWTWPAAQELEIGRSHDPYWYRFDGQMDDFRIYNRVLTPAEIGQVYASDAVLDASLTLRLNFDTAGIGNSVVWPFGTLLSSPVLGPSAVWTPVSGATAPSYPIPATNPAQFYRATP